MKNIEYIGAGAGSGKTYNLTEKIVEMVLGDYKMSELILTTFTKKAAAEFRKKTREKLLARAEKETKSENKERLLKAATELDSAMIGTVHSVCMQYIRKYWYKLGISARVTEMDEDAKKEHLSRTITASASEDDTRFFQKFASDFDVKKYDKKLNFDFWQSNLTDIIKMADSFDIDDLGPSEAKSKEIAALALSKDGCQMIPCGVTEGEESCRAKMDECISRIFDIARKWRTDFKGYKEDQALIEFSDMETMFLNLLSDKEVQSEIASSIKFLFVDEFQDSNPKQIKIFDKLSELVEKSYWVGDPKQSIYKFRGSDIELVRAVINKSDGSVTKAKPLSYSYRSDKRLVETANKVFEPVFSEVLSSDEITLNSVRGDHLPGGAKSLHHWDLMRYLNPEDNKYSCKKEYLNYAIAAQIAAMVNHEHEICKVIDKDSGEERDIVPSDIAVLTRSGEGGDAEAIINALIPWGVPIIHEGKIRAHNYEIQLVSLLLNYFISSGSSLLDAELCRLMFDMTTEEILAKNHDELQTVTSCLDSIKSEVGNGSIAGIVRSIILRLDLLNKCGKWGYQEDRRRNLICLMKVAEEYDSTCLNSGKSATVEGFLSLIAEDVKIPEGFYPGGVTVCTYHKSKGLEWNVVVLTSLGSDHTSDTAVLKHYVRGTKIVRQTAPTEENIYSDYYITSVPSFCSLKDIKGQAAETIKTTGEFIEYKYQEIAEAQRLLYVGFTRARDYLVSTSNRGNGRYGKLSWFEAIDLSADTIDANWPDESLQTVWGTGTEPCNFRKIAVEFAPEKQGDKFYHFIPQTEPDKTENTKRIAPSALHDEGLVKRATLKFLDLPEGEQLVQTVKTVRPYEKETTIGTCIHNIFAVFNPDAPHGEMVALAERTIRNFSLEENLPDAEALICSIENLYDFLKKNYGPAVKTEREIPFREIRGGQTCVGSIDFVWFTSDKECVLVDYKNLSMASAGVVDPENEEYLGHYIPQQKAYKDALERAGFTVKACLLHLSLQEKVIQICF